MTIPVNKRDTSASVLIASFTIGIGDLSVGAAYDIMALDSEGNPIIAFVAYSDGEALHLRESTEYGTHGANVVTLDKTKENALRLECFAAEGVCNIYLNGECVFVTTLYYSETNRYLEPKSFAFLSKSASSVITLDDIVVDSYNKIYIKEDVEVKEDSDTVYTFDYAGGMNIPAGITGSKGKLSVSEVLKDGAADKALIFSPNNKDTESMSIPLKNKEQVENASCYVFESEMSFKSGKNDVKYEINFYNGSGNDAIAYRISVVFDNKVFLRDNDGRKTGEATYPVAEFNGWFKLRAEYYPIIDENGEDALRVKVFVNGEHLYTSVHPWGNGTYGGDVETSLTRVEIYACASTETPVYLDNISFTSNNEEYVEE